MFVDEFLSQFDYEKRDQVREYVMILGIDLANKTGSRNSQELYQLLKHFAKNIVQQTGDLRGEIKTIQKQLRDLNDLLYSRDQVTSKKQYAQPIVQLQSHTPRKHQSQSQPRNLTPKITESPPPPQIVYINRMNKYDIKPQFDDRQIKKLMYDTDRGRPYKNPSPQQLVYSQTSGGYSQRHGSEFYHNIDNRKQTCSPKKLPAYLQGVESKIKPIIDQDKQQYKEQGTTKKLQQSAETDTYFDIQQYIQEQKRYQFSPVQEMNDKDSDTYSNFTPPDDEVKEFFQQQYLLQQ